MTLSCASIVGDPIEEVFDWHARRGAIHRLTPPWQPVRVMAEADSLRDGTAVLGLPGGIRWHARHSRGDYDPPRRFVDELVGLSPLPRTPIRWRHVHDFRASDEATRVSDTVETTVPPALLGSMFAFRHRQLADDLDAMARSRAWSTSRRVVAVTGASGMVGTALCALLTTSGHRVVRLVRREPSAGDERRWEPDNPDPELLAGIDAVIHLAGASIGGRFTPAHRRAIRDSRLGPTRRLAEVAARAGLAAFVSASAIGVYGADRGDEVLTEDSAPGSGFLAEVVADWEAATAPAAAAGVRIVQVRTGVVQSAAGGALPMLARLFRTGLGGRLGDGRQWMAWIGLDDLADIYRRALLDESIRGPVNAVAPEPVRNDAYSRVLGRVLHRPAVVPVPAFGPRLLLGRQGACELALANQRVVPRRLEASGHSFRRPDLAETLGHTLGRLPLDPAFRLG